MAKRAPKEPFTATMLCRIGSTVLRDVLDQSPTDVPWPAFTDQFKGAVKGLYGVLIYVEDKELLGDLEQFTEDRVKPAIEAWAQGFRDVELGDEYLLLPFGCSGAANVRYGGVATRCIIMEDQPVGERDVPGRRWTKYYDVAHDVFREGYCATVVSFWVHTPDTAAKAFVI